MADTCLGLLSMEKSLVPTDRPCGHAVMCRERFLKHIFLSRRINSNFEWCGGEFDLILTTVLNGFETHNGRELGWHSPRHGDHIINLNAPASMQTKKYYILLSNNCRILLQTVCFFRRTRQCIYNGFTMVLLIIQAGKAQRTVVSAGGRDKQ